MIAILLLGWPQATWSDGSLCPLAIGDLVHGADLGVLIQAAKEVSHPL